MTKWTRRSVAIAAGSVALLAPMMGAQAAPTPRTSCPGVGWTDLEVAHEIINTGSVMTDPKAPMPTYKAAGDNEVPTDVWTGGYQPPSPYIKNTTRNLQFNQSQFLGSPGAPVCETTYVTTSDGYTWAGMSEAINAMWPYDRSQYESPSNINAYYAGNMVTTPAAGVVKVTANYKAQNMKFWANEDGVPPGTPGAQPIMRFFITDQWGNSYIMHASNYDNPADVQQAFNDAVLPEGWTKQSRYLTKDLVLHPAEGSDGTFHYLVFRDSADNTYHQYQWSNEGNLEAQVNSMPIWGGQDNNVLRGDANGRPRADLIHGASGDDRLVPGYGNDEVWGDAGVDRAVLPGRWKNYTVTSAGQGGAAVVLSRGSSSVSLNYVEKVTIGNKTVKTSDLHTP